MIFALVLTATLMLVEVIGSFVTGSLALLADAGHMLTDVAALGLSLGAAWLTQRPATRQRTFGFHRAEILAALLNGMSLLVLSLYVIYEAISRLWAPPVVESGLLLVIAAAGLIANAVAGAVLLSSAGANLNVRSAYLHVVGDALGSVGALIAAGLMYVFGWYLADPLLSLALSVLLIWGAWRLLRETVDVLLEAAPASVDVAEVQRVLQAMPAVTNVHDLHVWSVASNFVALSGHVRLVHMPMAEYAQILQDLRHELHSRFGIEHVTLQLEPAEPAPATVQPPAR
ncbi:MAG: cation diffusion facilitator family transporter [Chloroflexota bacterium]|nr:cation diffusion facilitator family transporter [Chloroflexota bacterium]